VTTPAQHDRDQAAARVSKLKHDLRGQLSVAADLEEVEAMDRLIATAEQLLRTELAFEEAVHRLAAAELEAKHASAQRTVVYYAAAPVLVAMVAGALVLFEAIGAVWLLPAIPLFAAGLRIAFGPIRLAADVVRERMRAARAGAVAAALMVLALLPWPSVAATAVFTVLAVVAVAATAGLVVKESRLP
jgi:hypothetical protein